MNNLFLSELAAQMREFSLKPGDAHYNAAKAIDDYSMLLEHIERNKDNQPTNFKPASESQK